MEIYSSPTWNIYTADQANPTNLLNPKKLVLQFEAHISKVSLGLDWKSWVQLWPSWLFRHLVKNHWEPMTLVQNTYTLYSIAHTPQQTCRNRIKAFSLLSIYFIFKIYTLKSTQCYKYPVDGAQWAKTNKRLNTHIKSREKINLYENLAMKKLLCLYFVFKFF